MQEQGQERVLVLELVFHQLEQGQGLVLEKVQVLGMVLRQLLLEQNF